MLEKLQNSQAVVDPGFPVGEGVHPLGGHGPLTWALFGENVCKNKRIGSHRGGMCWAHPPRSTNAKFGHSKSIWTTLVRKYWKSCKTVIIGHSESIWTTLIGKYRKSCKMAKIGHSKSILTSLVGKCWKSCKSAKIGHSGSIWTTSVGKYWKSCKTTYSCAKNGGYNLHTIIVLL